MKKKCLAIGIIFLFVGVTIAPTISFNTVKASTDDDLVEVTTQACGIQGYRDTTVKLTRAHYQNLKQYLIDFGAQLNNTKTREEAIPFFKKTIVELNKYRLLPTGMSIKTAQKLVIRNLYRSQLTENGTSNLFCLWYSHTNYLYVKSHMMQWGEKVDPDNEGFQYILMVLSMIKPFYAFCPILTAGLLGYEYQTYVFTMGLHGLRIWTGHLEGNTGRNYTVALGYSGLQLFVGPSIERIHIGTAIYVNMKNIE